MAELIAKQFEETGTKMCHSFKLQSLLSKFTIFSFVPITVLCLIMLKLYNVVLLVFRWLSLFKCHIECPTILVLGPKNEIVQEMVAQLSQKFNSKIINLQDRNDNIIKERVFIYNKKQKKKESRVIYGNIPTSSQEDIIAFSKFVQRTYDFVDILIIAQDEKYVESRPTHSFLTHLNRQLLTTFWTVMAFLPGMLQRNRGYIISIALGKSYLVNTGIMRSIHEELLQCDTNVKMALLENNSTLENYLPLLSTNIKAKLLINSMWNFESVVKVPSLPMYVFMLPLLFIQFMKKLAARISMFVSSMKF